MHFVRFDGSRSAELRPSRWSAPDQAADRGLARALADGHTDAASQLGERYTRRLFDYAYCVLGDSSQSTEVVYDTLIDAMRRGARIRDHGQLTGWLYAATRRRLLGRRHRSGLVWEPDARSAEILGSLTLAEQEIVVLALRHALPITTLALVLEISPRKARARLHKAAFALGEDSEAGLWRTAQALARISSPPLPHHLSALVVHAATDPYLSPHTSDIAARGGILTDDGIPHQPDAPPPVLRRSGRTALSAGGRAGVILLATATTATLAVGSGAIPYMTPPSPGHSSAQRIGGSRWQHYDAALPRITPAPTSSAPPPRNYTPSSPMDVPPAPADVPGTAAPAAQRAGQSPDPIPTGPVASPLPGPSTQSRSPVTPPVVRSVLRPLAALTPLVVVPSLPPLPPLSPLPTILDQHLLDKTALPLPTQLPQLPQLPVQVPLVNK